MHVLLSGIVGSTAYGLAHRGSDVDRLGVFAAPTVEFHGLHQPKESVVTTNPDFTLHEARKLCKLALGCNPTAMELMWLPERLYEVRTPLGDELIELRSTLLGSELVRRAYLGYATKQFQKLNDRGDGSFSSDLRKRTAKHARHLARLIAQGVELYRTGSLRIELDDPDWYRNFGEQVAAGNAGIALELLAGAERALYNMTSPLPAHPDPAPIEAWLRRVRLAHLETA
ncbi:nucleotidyltransferase domain-containing protein [Micromonospora maritima]|uniref:nucleotidyltransferase domain-containing protein n=1 Tax=Micromonospora maritima TaxID=986711 RepID=UPI00157D7195|nr:nucleotidyltransferase domain-containing protein [Micromonospora maritima]